MRMLSLKKNRLFIALLLLFICINSVFCASTSVCAAETQTAFPESYIYELNNQVIEYYLDEDDMPYVIRNGIRVPIALPLEHMLVTDKETRANLNLLNNNSSFNYSAFSIPSSYFDMRNGGTYTETISLSNSYSYTSYIRINQSRPIIRIRTSNEIKNSFFTGKKISYVVYYYFEATDSWYSYTVNDCNVSNDIGGALDIGSGIYSYVYYGVKKSSDLSQVDVHIWQSDI